MGKACGGVSLEVARAREVAVLSGLRVGLAGVRGCAGVVDQRSFSVFGAKKWECSRAAQ